MTTLFPADPIGLQARARRMDPETSHEAAAKVNRSNDTERRRMMYLQYLKAHPGSTYAEIALALDADRYDVGKRLPELLSRELVRRGKKRPCSTNGNAMHEWYAVEETR